MMTALPMSAQPSIRSRWFASAAFAAAGVLFLLYPAIRPYGDSAEATSAAAFASPAWLVAHLAAVAGFVLIAFALLAVRDRLATTPGDRLARAALAIWWVGIGLVLPYYGAEAFALHVLGEQAVQTGGSGLLALVDAVRMGPVQITAFGAGLVLLGVAGVVLAVAVARSGLLSRWTGIGFAAGFALLLPQVYAAPGLRIAHGVLVAAGCLVLAAELRKA
jgi:hypothetical protein